MGKKNRLKHLIGRFNEDTNCELKALPYSLGDTVCEMLLKVDLNHANSLALANVPYFLDEAVLKQLLSSSLGTDISDVNLTTSTALHGNLNRGYRSGRIVFRTIHARRRAFDSINATICPFKLENMGVKLPAWHRPISNCLGKRKHAVEETEGMELTETGARCLASGITTIDQNNEDGWTIVTKKHKFSFRGEINRFSGGYTNVEEKKIDRTTEELIVHTKKKKRSR